jgi:hypothetical protein
MSAAPGKVTIHGEVVSRNGKPLHIHENYNKSYKERHADVESDARANNLVIKLDDELRKYDPDFGVVLRYYFDHFEQLTKSSFVKGAHFFNAFSRTLHKYFFPPNVMLWHWDGEKCVNHGPGGDHDKYREFLCYIVKRAHARGFTPLELAKLNTLFFKTFEEQGLARVTFIDYDQEILDIFNKYDDTRDPVDGHYTFCKGDKAVDNGIEVSNSKLNKLLRQFMNSLHDKEAEEIIAGIVADARKRAQQRRSKFPSRTVQPTPQAPEGGSNRSNRAPIRRKSANRRTPRRRNNTRKYCKK